MEESNLHPPGYLNPIYKPVEISLKNKPKTEITTKTKTKTEIKTNPKTKTKKGKNRKKETQRKNKRNREKHRERRMSEDISEEITLPFLRGAKIKPSDIRTQPTVIFNPLEDDNDNNDAPVISRGFEDEKDYILHKDDDNYSYTNDVFQSEADAQSSEYDYSALDNSITLDSDNEINDINDIETISDIDVLETETSESHELAYTEVPQSVNWPQENKKFGVEFESLSSDVDSTLIIPDPKANVDYMEVVNFYRNPNNKLKTTSLEFNPEIYTIQQLQTFMRQAAIEDHMNQFFKHQVKTMGVNKDGKTPDMIIGASKNPDGTWNVPPLDLQREEDGYPIGTVIDFKCIFATTTSDAYRNKLEAEMRNKYGKDTITIIINWGRSGATGKQMRNGRMMKKMKTILDERLRSLSPTEFEKVKLKARIEDSYDTSTDMLNHLQPKFIKAAERAGDSYYSEEQLEEVFQPLDTIIEELLQNIQPAEEFANRNVIKGSEMVDQIPIFNITQNPSIYHEHPFDSKKNKDRYNQTHGTNHAKGQKASFLLPAVFMWYNEPIHESELQAIAKKSNDPIWKDLYDIYRFSNSTLDQQDAIGKLFRRMSYHKTTASDEARKDLGEEFGVEIRNSDAAVKLFKGKIENVLETVKPLLSGNGTLRLTAHGRLLVGSKNNIFSKAAIDKSRNKDLEDKPEPVMENYDYMKDIEKEYLMLNPDPYNLEIPDHMGLCEGLEWENEISDDLVQRALKGIKANTDSIYFGTTWRYQKHLHTLMATLGRGYTKGSKLRESVLITDPYSGLNMIGTAAPNEQTGGAVVYFGKVPTSKWEKGIELAWAGRPFIYRTKEFVYYYTNPFRHNWEALADTQTHMWGFLAFFASNTMIDQSMTNSILTWSMAWTFSRPVKFMLDMLYLFDKNAYVKLNFGKFEIAKKFEDMKFHDVRSMTMLHRMVKGHKEFSKKAYESTETDQGSQMRNIIHHIFDIPLSGWYGAQIIGYMRQLLSKVDGADPVHKMAGFYNDNKKFESWIRKSPFRPEIYDWEKNEMTIKRFVELVFASKEGGDWEESAFHAAACYRITRLLVENTDDGKRKDFRDLWKVPASSTGKNTATLMPSIEIDTFTKTENQSFQNKNKNKDKHNKSYKSREEEIKNNKFDANKKKASIRIPGLQSMDTASAIESEAEFIRRVVENEHEQNPPINDHDGNPIFPKGDPMFPSGTWNKIKMKQLSLYEMSLYEVAIHGQYIVVTMQLKDQRDYNKRAFFVQLLYNRNCNKLYDSVARPLLMHSSNPSDLILSPGMDKYIKIQHKTEEIKSKTGNMKVFQDMTKYGDSWVVDSMGVQLYAWRDSKLIEEKEFKFLWYLKDCLKKRVIMMPLIQYKKWRNIKKEIAKDDDEHIVIEKNGKRYVLEMEQGIFGHFADQTSKNAILGRHPFTVAMKDYPGLVRESGATLGVFNVLWSLYSAGISLTKKLLIDKIYRNPERIARFDTHSDDAQDHTTLDMPGIEDFQDLRATELIKRLTRNGKIFFKIFKRGEKVWIHNPETRKDKGTDFPWTTASKLYVVLGLLIPRLYSQRPSLLKCSIGTASEMLQVVSTSGGRIFVPLVRYISTIMADTTGLSPTLDTLSAVGRVYETLVNGAPRDLIAMLLILINTAIGERFGIPAKKRSKTSPLELGGLWWATPHRIKQFGFKANLGRLLAIAQNKGANNVVKRKIKLMLFTEFIWKSKSKPVKEYEEQLIRIVNQEIEASALDMMRSVPELFKDFMISWGTWKKTEMIMLQLAERLRPFIARFVEDDPESTDVEFFKYVRDRLGSELMIAKGSALHDTVRILSKYLTASFQNSRLRISRDSRLVRRWGYYLSLVSNPFSWLIRSKTVDKNGESLKETMSIKEVISHINFVAQSNFKIPDFHERAYNLLVNRYGDMVSSMIYDTAVIKFEKREGHFEDVPARYRKIQLPLSIRVDTTQIMVAVVYRSSEIKNGLDGHKSSWIYAHAHSNLKPEELKHHLETVNNIMSQLNIKNHLELDRHARTIMSLFSPVIFEGVAKAPIGEINDYAMNSMMEFYSWNTVLRINMVFKNTHVPNQLVHKAVIDTSSIARFYIPILWNLQLRGNELPKSEHLYVKKAESLVINFDSSSEFEILIKEDPQVPNFNRQDWSSNILAILLWRSSMFGSKLSIETYSFDGKYRPDLEWGLTLGFVINIQDFPSVGVILINQRSKDPTWVIYGQNTNLDSTATIGISSQNYIWRMGIVLSYIMTSRLKAISDPSKIDADFYDKGDIFVTSRMRKYGDEVVWQAEYSMENAGKAVLGGSLHPSQFIKEICQNMKFRHSCKVDAEPAGFQVTQIQKIKRFVNNIVMFERVKRSKFITPWRAPFRRTGYSVAYGNLSESYITIDNYINGSITNPITLEWIGGYGDNIPVTSVRLTSLVTAHNTFYPKQKMRNDLQFTEIVKTLRQKELIDGMNWSIIYSLISKNICNIVTAQFRSTGLSLGVESDTVFDMLFEIDRTVKCYMDKHNSPSRIRGFLISSLIYKTLLENRSPMRDNKQMHFLVPQRLILKTKYLIESANKSNIKNQEDIGNKKKRSNTSVHLTAKYRVDICLYIDYSSFDNDTDSSSEEHIYINLSQTFAHFYPVDCINVTYDINNNISSFWMARKQKRTFTKLQEDILKKIEFAKMDHFIITKLSEPIPIDSNLTDGLYSIIRSTFGSEGLNFMHKLAQEVKCDVSDLYLETSLKRRANISYTSATVVIQTHPTARRFSNLFKAAFDVLHEDTSWIRNENVSEIWGKVDWKLLLIFKASSDDRFIDSLMEYVGIIG